MSDTISLFTTLRFTCPTSPVDRDHDSGGNPSDRMIIDKSHIPLIERHIARLRTAHTHYVQVEGEAKWGVWPGDEAVWVEIQEVLQLRADGGAGDYRVRVLLHPGAILEIQTPPAPRDAGPFTLDVPPTPPGAGSSAAASTRYARRPLVLDPIPTDLSLESPYELSKRRYKTTSRHMYDAAAARAPQVTPPGYETLLWTKEGRLLETCTSNIALWMPCVDEETGGGAWVTPRLDREKQSSAAYDEQAQAYEAVFLNGVVRQEFLSKGLMREGDVTVQDLQRCREEGRPVIGFNGLRCMAGRSVKCHIHFVQVSYIRYRAILEMAAGRKNKVPS